MKLLIPTIGTLLEVRKPWKFTLYSEYRNHDALERFGAEKVINSQYYWRDRNFGDTVVTLPKGTVLKVERIYIRNGAGDFDSLTFRVVKSQDSRIINPNGRGGIRFWAKLPECNGMDCDILESLTKD